MSEGESHQRAGDAQAHPCGLLRRVGKGPKVHDADLVDNGGLAGVRGGREPFPGRGMAVGCMVRLSQLSWPPRLSSNCRRRTCDSAAPPGAAEAPCKSALLPHGIDQRRPGPLPALRACAELPFARDPKPYAPSTFAALPACFAATRQRHVPSLISSPALAARRRCDSTARTSPGAQPP